ncbi:MAG: hypothetical protein IT426_15730 [Pirellulales bacterium]|nr:hypothetical protein [Pirellulales bacterium]
MPRTKRSVCRRVDAEISKQWAAWPRAWGEPFDVDVAKAAAGWELLKKKTPQGEWRLRQWELKLELFTAHRDIGDRNKWTPERLAAVDRFWAAQEKLYREVWRLPPQRNGLGRNYTEVPWHAGWAKFEARQSGTLGKEQ